MADELAEHKRIEAEKLAEREWILAEVQYWKCVNAEACLAPTLLILVHYQV